MIPRSSLSSVGTFVKPHGIHGELSADTDLAPEQIRALTCVFVYIDGLAVPMFIEAVRPRGHGALLLTIDGIDDERKAKTLAGKEIFVLDSELPEDDADDDAAFYLEDLQGYTVTDRVDGNDIAVGTVTGYDDSTANVLLEVTDAAGRTLHIPVADELVLDIDDHHRIITMNLPSGLTDL